MLLLLEHDLISKGMQIESAALLVETRGFLCLLCFCLCLFIVDSYIWFVLCVWFLPRDAI